MRPARLLSVAMLALAGCTTGSGDAGLVAVVGAPTTVSTTSTTVAPAETTTTSMAPTTTSPAAPEPPVAGPAVVPAGSRI